MKQDHSHSDHDFIYDYIVFCHLRWDFVFQRPQHIVSRLAKKGKVLFVEEPIGSHRAIEDSTIRVVNDHLHVLQPAVDRIDQIPDALRALMPDMKTRVIWMYSPSFVPVLDALRAERIVYDCMDELTLFRGAPAELVAMEQQLLDRADVVFTGGPRLYESKRALHSNVHCYPSSVDSAHFEKALNGIAVPGELLMLSKPVIGYYGVLDERIDFDLIAETARLMPEANFVMVGPLAKITEADLPRAKNIHYPGMKDYTELPSYLKGFDIAMMPFAMNDATKYISPTKTLEYMAARKPIISTPVFDVVRSYSHCVHIVNDAKEFQQEIVRIMSEEDMTKKNRKAAFEEILNNTSWDRTVEGMSKNIAYEKI
ncbi:MAG: glycosyltransferase [Bacteroidetes bacterium]|nr:glycosyltransferase [Bacteroidota bacterium]